MDINLQTAILGIIAGALGYWFATFSVQPILVYREVRSRVHSNFIYYAQVTSPDGLDENMKLLFEERILANRRTSAELSAAYLELPCWYHLYLNCKKHDPQGAATNLIGFSNTYEHEPSHQSQETIRKKLGLPKGT